MVKTQSPLRYPGGKSVLSSFFESYIRANSLDKAIYVEPYCGGAGAAINLLLCDKVDQIWLNDANYSIYSFWYCLKHLGESFLQKLECTPVTVKEWIRQKKILMSVEGKTYSSEDLLANGFATFYLNRCNRSGILNAGPIGGKGEDSQKSATYKIDARFNKKVLKEKLSAIIAKSDQIRVFNQDALNFLKYLSSECTLETQKELMVYLDPPYYKQGSSLYLNYYTHRDHQDIAKYLLNDHAWKWLLSYDNVVEIRNLYSAMPQYSFYINYSAQESKLGNELLIHSLNSTLPESLVIKEQRNNKRIELEKLRQCMPQLDTPIQ